MNDQLKQTLIELLPDKGSDFVVTAVVAILGYFIGGAIHNRKKKKEARELEQKTLKASVDLISPKFQSIPRDILLYIHSYTFIAQHENQTGFKESVFYKDMYELKQLCKIRIEQNIEEILDISVVELDSNKPIKNIVENTQSLCKNLRNLMKVKSEDDQKARLLKEIEEDMKKQYQQLMTEYRKAFMK